MAGVSSAEILATYCDNILKTRGGSEKLSEEATEITLEKVVFSFLHTANAFNVTYPFDADFNFIITGG